MTDTLALDSEIDWSKEDLEAVRRTVTKKFNAEIHSQSALEAIMYLRERQPCHPNQIERIDLDTFDVGYDLLGRYAKASEYQVRNNSEAYRSLRYLLAVALLDESGKQIMEKVLDLEDIRVRGLTELLASVDRTTQKKNQEEEFALRRYKRAA